MWITEALVPYASTITLFCIPFNPITLIHSVIFCINAERKWEIFDMGISFQNSTILRAESQFKDLGNHLSSGLRWMYLLHEGVIAQHLKEFIFSGKSRSSTTGVPEWTIARNQVNSEFARCKIWRLAQVQSISLTKARLHLFNDSLWI